jgi:hypothetical protein
MGGFTGDASTGGQESAKGVLRSWDFGPLELLDRLKRPHPEIIAQTIQFP